MRKQILTIGLLLLTFGKIFAGVVPLQTAQTVAVNFFKATVTNYSGTPTLKLTKTEPDGTVDFYVFDMAPAKGFVIVSAFDNAEPVLAYSFESKFSTNVKTIGVSDWMETTGKKINALVKQNIAADVSITSKWTSYTKGSALPLTRSGTVAPLLAITWNQEPYYNLFCPYNTTDKQRAVTGCVATAMAQIMKFWNYPAKGTGSYSYTSGSYGVQSANFGATTYQWTKMPNAVTSTTDTAVATLMYQCGVAVAMSYGDDNQGGSGAAVIQSEAGGSNAPCAQNAYHTYFGYNAAAMSGVHQSSYTAAAWISLLQAELNAGRPIQYAGWESSGGGHTWVCDGYDASSNFHMNWGWGGYDNGYFNITNLNPNPYVFNSNDEALIGIQPGTSTGCGVASGLAASSITTSSATVSWGAVTGATSYNLQYKVSTSSTWTTVSVSTASRSLTGLTAGTTYNFQVQTVCSGGSSAYSAASSFNTLTSCGTPTNLASTSITTSSATVSWAAVTGAITYNLQYKVSTSSTWTTVSVSNASQSLTGLTAGTTYNFQVQTVCSAGSSAYSAASSFNTLTSCGTPVSLSSSAITTTSATVSWAAVTGAITYNLQYKVSTSSTWTTVSVSTASRSLTGLTAATTYNFQVQTVCSAGSSAYSAASSFSTLTSCGAPVSLNSSAITTTSATVSWAAVSGAITYNLQYKVSTASTWTTISTAASSYNLTGLMAASTYNFQVQTVCSGGPSAYSTTASFTTSSGGTVSYCTSKGNSQSFEYIKSIAFGAFTNASGSNGGYGNFRTSTIPLTSSGVATTFTLTPGYTSSTFPEYFVIYIDYNGNGVFTDAGEKVYVSGAAKAATNGSFTVPAGLNLNTRMRVIMQYGTPATNPCGNYSYGETEDYTVNISPTNIASLTLGDDHGTLLGGGDNTSSIYPNPTAQMVNVMLSPVENVQTKVEIVSVNGQTVLSQMANGTEQEVRIDVSSLPAGVYMVRTIYGNERVSAEKLIKQ